ncbi:unnamed protein product [Mycena citricolor]|uniref:F-box domain-containing protein n=1 Tax=Mycena citricolor TaxID=2018698 RepID=A0AAD2K1Z0_9AGAR|nr:unnamed protein product [Mycena citricolor]
MAAEERCASAHFASAHKFSSLALSHHVAPDLHGQWPSSGVSKKSKDISKLAEAPWSHMRSVGGLVLPPELTDRIVDFLWQSRPDLFRCSLVCRHWVATSRKHLFECFIVKTSGAFFSLLHSVLRNHTRILDFRLWPSNSHPTALSLLPSLSLLRGLTVLVLGSFPPDHDDLPVLPHVRCLSLQHTKFRSAAQFARLMARLPDVSELKLAWVTWGDATDGRYPYGAFEAPLEHLSVRGFQTNPDVLTWLRAGADAPQTKGLSLHIPSAKLPSIIPVFAGFITGLNGILQDLHLDVHPCPSLEDNLRLLGLETLTSLRRFRIGHGIYFHWITSHYRLLPSVLGLHSMLSSSTCLEEIIFDVDLMPTVNYTLSPQDGNEFRLRDLVLQTRAIPSVRFQMLTRDIASATALVRFQDVLRKEGISCETAVTCDYERNVQYKVFPSP